MKNFFNFQSYCNGKLQRLAVCKLWSLWRHSFHYASAFELKGLTTRSFSCLREKETDSIVWKSVEASRNKITLYKTSVQRCTGSVLMETQWANSGWRCILLTVRDSCAHKRQSVQCSGEAASEYSMAEWRWNCTVRCEWSTGFEQCQGHEPQELNVWEQTYFLRIILKILAAVFYIHYYFNYCIFSVNKHCYLLHQRPICYTILQFTV